MKEAKRVDWSKVDPWLKVVKSVAAVSIVAKRFGVSKWAIWDRRKKLKLPSLPKGRPVAQELTSMEAEVRKGMDQGMTAKEIAVLLSTSAESAANAMRRVKEKELRKALYCDTCKGLGLTECSSCRSTAKSGPHFHVCATCGGNSALTPHP